MKTSTMILLLSCFLAIPAWAAPQTDDCGRNMTQLSTVIRSKFNGVFSANYAQKFVGVWSSGLTSFEISPNQNFMVNNLPYEICPQSDKSFYIFQVSDKSQSASFKLHGQSATLYNGAGLLAWGNGEFSHGISVAKNQN